MDIRFISSVGYDLFCEPCTESGTATILHIWDGNGALDDGNGWIHSGFGIEASNAKHTGSNGLDTGILNEGETVIFTHPSGSYDIQDYGLLIMWIRMKTVSNNADISIAVHTIGGTSSSVNLSRYITMDVYNMWQKVVIPLTHFSKYSTDNTFDVYKLTLRPTGVIKVWLDDISFTHGGVSVIDVCPPDIVGIEYGKKSVKSEVLVPSMRSKFPSPFNI